MVQLPWMAKTGDQVLTDQEVNAENVALKVTMVFQVSMVTTVLAVYQAAKVQTAKMVDQVSLEAEDQSVPKAKTVLKVLMVLLVLLV